MGLFDKKFCDICGDKIGLLGNRKLEDGNMCKDCAKKLSPFFSDRRSSTIEEIKQQLAYREQNKQVLASFRPNLTFGDSKKIYVDTVNGNFVVSSYSPNNWDDENPDVMPLSSITSCNLNIDEDRDEIYTQGKDGQSVSYNPPRYKYSYDFYLEFTVNNPYFDDFKVKLNTFSVEGVGTMEYNKYQQMAMEIINTLTPGRGVMPNMGMNNGMPMNQGMPVNQGYAPAGGFVQQGTYAQPNPYAQQQGAYAQQPMNNGYGQPMNNGYNQPMNNGYGQPMNNGYAQQPMNNGYNQPMNNGYAQQTMNNGYNQQPMNNGYNQPAQPQPQAQGLECPFCGSPYTGGDFCTVCGAKMPG